MTQQDVEPILSRFVGTKILIVGDVMLDEYVWGEVRRISQEAPIPVVEVQRRTYAPGGAANVATNVTGLGGLARIGGVVGQDEGANQLRRLLLESGVLVDGLLSDTERPTTLKTRIVAHSQQVVRVDMERRTPLSAELEEALLHWATTHLAEVGACVLSDYSKGVVSAEFSQRLIGLARERNKPIIVDPKSADFSRYRGATVITPNVLEAERAVKAEISGNEDLERVGRQLLDVLGDSQLLLTRGAQGLALFAPNADTLTIPAVARNVYDVTGAGDTVVSTLALALAAGATMEQAARLANRAAGIVVGKLGTARVTLSELQQHPEI